MMCLRSLILWYKMTKKKDNLVSTSIVNFTQTKAVFVLLLCIVILSSSLSCRRWHLVVVSSSFIVVVSIISSPSHRHLHHIISSSSCHCRLHYLVVVVLSSSCHYRLRHLVVSILNLKEIHMWVFLGRGGQQPPGTNLPLFFPSWEHVLHMLCHSQRPRYRRYLWSCLWDDGGGMCVCFFFLASAHRFTYILRTLCTNTPQIS